MNNKVNQQMIGLGDTEYTFAVYIGNQPLMPEYQSLKQLAAIHEGDIALISQACGNGWRKVFNVYAKLLYALNVNDFPFSTQAATWQTYRDQYLLQANSRTALIFSPLTAHLSSIHLSNSAVHIICGKTYAKQLMNNGDVELQLTWVDEEFAIDLKHRVIVCPYFDYRQLSNVKIQRLSIMLSGLLAGKIIG
jgi:hypothetical protein